eukprot:m.118814 g.118814  ORF g.118814 m.118814 type:complete len:372 (-) comp14520_c0_seq2:456-1571(-)
MHLPAQRHAGAEGLARIDGGETANGAWGHRPTKMRTDALKHRRVSLIKRRRGALVVCKQSGNGVGQGGAQAHRGRVGDGKGSTLTQLVKCRKKAVSEHSKHRVGHHRQRHRYRWGGPACLRVGDGDVCRETGRREISRKGPGGSGQAVGILCGNGALKERDENRTKVDTVTAQGQRKVHALGEGGGNAVGKQRQQRCQLGEELLNFLQHPAEEKRPAIVRARRKHCLIGLMGRKRRSLRVYVCVCKRKRSMHALYCVMMLKRCRRLVSTSFATARYGSDGSTASSLVSQALRAARKWMRSSGSEKTAAPRRWPMARRQSVSCTSCRRVCSSPLTICVAPASTSSAMAWMIEMSGYFLLSRWVCARSCRASS